MIIQTHLVHQKAFLTLGNNANTHINSISLPTIFSVSKMPHPFKLIYLENIVKPDLAHITHLIKINVYVRFWYKKVYGSKKCIHVCMMFFQTLELTIKKIYQLQRAEIMKKT